MTTILDKQVPVPGEGPYNCKICFIGEAPGTTEAAKKRPFVGVSGQHLDKLLKSTGILRRDCRVTNVIKEQPQNNDISHFISKTTTGTVTTHGLFSFYLEYLIAELEKCTTCNVFVPVGNIALHILTGLSGITKYRGSILSAILPGIKGRKVIPIIHPAAALRDYKFTYYISLDLRRIQEDSTFPELSLPKRDLIVAPLFIEAKQYLDEVDKATRVAFDIEVYNQEISCISFALSPSRSMSIPFVKLGGNDYYNLDDEAYLLYRIAQILENPQIEKIATNTLFDTSFLLRRLGIKSINLQDIFIAQKIIYPDFEKSLAFQCSVHTREPFYKDREKDLFDNPEAQNEEFWRYNAKDSATAFEIMSKHRQALERTKNVATHERKRKILLPLLYIQERGIRVDIQGIKALSLETEEKLKELRAQFNLLTEKHGVINLNTKSSSQMRNYFYKTLKIKPYRKKTAGGRWTETADADALVRLARRGIQEAIILSTIRKCDKLQDTYCEMKTDSDGRVRSSYNPVGAVTGRLSSSKTIFGTGMNMQNQPSKMRRYYLADEGYLAFEIDLSQAEPRIVANITPEPTMLRAFENGIDIHSQTAAMLFNIPLEDVSDKDGSSPIGNGMRSQRYWGKRCNNGLNYGLGYKEFALQLGISETEAKILVEGYHDIYPAIRNRYHEMLKSMLGEDRIVTNCAPYNRRRRFTGRWNNQLFTKAYAHIPQSTVGDKVDEDGLNYIYYNPDKFEHLELLNQVHDSIWFQIPFSKVSIEEGSRMIEDTCLSLEKPISFKNREFFIPVDIKCGRNFEVMSAISRDNINEDIRRIWEDE